MKIVICDAQTVTNGDIDLSMFGEFGELSIYPLTGGSDTAERIRDADIVICNKTELGENNLAGAGHLKLITLFATGFNNIDTDYCAGRGICVCNAGSYSTEAVTQHTFALILEHFSRAGEYDRFVHSGGWFDTPTFSPFVFPCDELAGKTLGVVGLGSIGRRVAAVALAFGMRVLAFTRTPRALAGVESVSYDELLSRSDIITFHCPLTPETRGMFSYDAIAKCRDGAFVVNTARGAIIDDDALCAALRSSKLSGAGIDVLTREPMNADCVLYSAPNIIITPHVAWAPLATRRRLCSIVRDNIRAFLNEKPQNKVN